MAKTVIGLFENQQNAQSAVRDLASAGFSGNGVNVLTNAGSGLAGTLSQLNIPQSDAAIYTEGLSSGGALVILQQLADNDAEQAADILDRNGVVDIDTWARTRGQSMGTMSTSSSMSQGTSSMSQGTSGMSQSSSSRRNAYEGGEMVIPIVEEEINIGKREVESGGVRVETRVEERPVNEQVTLRNEEVTVERRSVDQPLDAATANSAFQEGSFELRERDEQAVVSKEARVVEEVVIGKQVEERTETISDTVRRTDVDVNQVGGTMQTGSSTVSGSTGMTGGQDEGMIERGASSVGNAVERGTGLDLDRDGDTGRRDPNNNF